MKIEKEFHPYLSQHFDSNKTWKYLIIGTFPPNKEIRKEKKFLVNYFYGNKGSLWKILGKIYTEFNFEKGSSEELISNIKLWQEKYCIGIVDTLVSLRRKDINSSDDSDFILEYEDYNHDLKSYILQNNNQIEKIFFTSSNGCNSAYETFKIIMGSDIHLIKGRLITDLPSPSGSSNTSWFNIDDESTLGLNSHFFDYVKDYKKQHLKFFEDRWEFKKIKKATKSKESVPSSPKGILIDFKVWCYKNVFPIKKD